MIYKSQGVIFNPHSQLVARDIWAPHPQNSTQHKSYENALKTHYELLKTHPPCFHENQTNTALVGSFCVSEESVSAVDD